MGTPRALTDANKSIVWQAQYTPFGEATQSIATVENNLRFSGQYFDEETNLHYNHFRYYDPSTGRYVQSDRIGLGDGPNTYLYVQANPLMYTDPNGLATFYGGGDVSFVPGVGGIAGAGTYWTTDDGRGRSGSGNYTSTGGRIGFDADVAFGIGFTLGDICDFAGDGESLGLDIGPISLDINFGSDGNFNGLGISITTPLPGVSYGRSKVEVYPTRDPQDIIDNPTDPCCPS